MSNRQKIGLRKKSGRTRAPGRARRKALLDAADALLCERDIEDIAFRDIAARADVPEGSAYHFFANRFDLFAALSKRLSDRFVQAHEKPVPASKRKSWDDAIAHLVDVGARVYKNNPSARQLFIGGKTPPEVKQADRINDRTVAAAMQRSIARYFDVPDSDGVHAAFFYFIEITDLMFTLSMIEHGRITAAMVSEAKRAGVAYLATYR